jgi:hypothetical protein
MRTFLFGNETALELIGWHMAVFLAFISGYSLSYFLGHHKSRP